MPNEIIFYKTPSGEQRIEVVYRDENFWMTQKALAELFGVKRPAITKHLGNIFSSKELVEKSVCSILEHTAEDGKTYETIHESADADKPHMGLITWKGSPKGKVLKSDVTVAKNYLNEQNLRELNRIVSAYLDLAENRAERQMTMNMADWSRFLNSFLELSSYPILEDKGKVSALEAKLKAEAEFEVFRETQDREYISDFDREVKRLKGMDEEQN
ncbi:MAG: RhuM family protein [Verrucomicrobia bacterium]|nr:RhuM family protein [Verrucomicrobiota bacterium]